jgi:rhomboid family GlyGly-CTERM serine protease
MLFVNQLKPFSLAIVIIAVCLVVQVLAPESLTLLRYQSLEVSEGEWWRIVSANFCHSNWNHFLLNMAGLLLMDYLFQPLNTLLQRTLLLIFCILTNVILIHIFLDMHWYVGLSGALHGFLLGNALIALPKARLICGAIILVVVIKLIVELNFEINSATADFIEANVVEEAHLFGAISGLFYWLGTYFQRFLPPRSVVKE